MNDVLDAQAQLEQSAESVETLTQSRVDKLWIRQFIEGLVSGTSFRGLMRLVENLTLIFIHAKQPQERTLDLQSCQVRLCCVLTLI